MSWDKYRSFGLREYWLERFLSEGPAWLESNLILGPCQLTALKRYLKDAELLDKSGKPTNLFKLLSRLYFQDRELAWQVIWLNLTQNSELFNWYAKAIEWGSQSYKKELKEKLSKEAGIKLRTASNAVNALLNTFKNAPLEWAGKLKGKELVEKKGLKQIKPELIAYTLKRLKLDPEKGAEVMGELFGLPEPAYTSALILAKRVSLWEEI